MQTTADWAGIVEEIEYLFYIAAVIPQANWGIDHKWWITVNIVTRN